MVGLSSLRLTTSLVAVGTSVPELATAIALVRQKRYDGLFGEVLGSNIFDILGIIGFTTMVVPIAMSGMFLVFLLASLVAIFFVFLIIILDREVSFVDGGLLVLLFAQFTYLIFYFQV